MFFRIPKKPMILMVILLAWITQALPCLASEVQQPSSGSNTATRQPSGKPPTIAEMKQQVEVSRSQRDKLQALLQHWNEEFGSKPKTFQVATCSDITTQERKANELRVVVLNLLEARKEAGKNQPQWVLKSSNPLLKKLGDLLKEYEQWVTQAKQIKVRIVEAKVEWLAKFSEEYFRNLEKLSNDVWVGAVAEVRQTLKDSACDPEQLTKATKDVDDREAQIKVMAANESTCRASRKCMHERALAEAMTSTVPNICSDLEDIKLSQREMVRLRSNPSGVVDRYRLMETGEKIQNTMAEMAELKATFAKETGQQFSARLCSKIPQ